jgi:capsular polysaccharide biosynthesis protein
VSKDKDIGGQNSTSSRERSGQGGKHSRQPVELFDFFLLLERSRLFLFSFIVIVTAAAGIYAFVIMESTYKSEATILVTATGASQSRSDTNEIKRLVTSLSPEMQFEVDSVVKQFKLNPVLQDVIDALSLDERFDLDVQDLAGIVQVTSQSGTNLLVVSAAYTDPAVSQAMVNQLIESFRIYVQRMQTDLLSRKAAYLESEMENALALYEQKFAEVQRINLDGKPLDVMRNDYESSVTALKAARESMESVDLDIQAVSRMYAELSAMLEGVDEKILLRTSLSSDSSFSLPAEEAEASGYSSADEMFNPVYEDLMIRKNEAGQELVRLEAQQELLDARIPRLESDIAAMLPKLREKEKSYENALKELEYAGRTFDAYQELLHEARIQIAADITENLLTVASYADLPEHDEESSLIVVVIGFIGALLGAVLIVIGREFYRSYRSYRER